MAEELVKVGNPKSGEINEFLAELDERFEVFEKTIQNLLNQVEPVLAPQAPQEDSPKVARDPRSQVGRQLSGYCEKLQRYSRYLNDAADRVEL